MKVFNLNSAYELSVEDIAYIESIVNSYDAVTPRPHYYPGNITDLMKEIPLLLVNEKTQREYSGGGDRLGFYQHRAALLDGQLPVVGLCLENITKNYQHPEECKIVTAAVVIHEFAHALMALSPAAFDYANPTRIRGADYAWVEEPLAEMITLSYFYHYTIHAMKMHHNVALPQTDRRGVTIPIDLRVHSHRMGIDEYECVRRFVWQGGADLNMYRLGLVLFDAGIREWWLWRNVKATVDLQRIRKWRSYIEPIMQGRTSPTEGVDAKMLRQQYADVVGSTVDVMTPLAQSNSKQLCLMAASGDVDGLKKLVRQKQTKAVINQPDAEGLTALHHAAIHGHKAACNVLLRNGASVDAQDVWGSTALHLATQYGHLDVLKLLVKATGNVDAPDSHGRSALFIAVKSNVL